MTKLNIPCCALCTRKERSPEKADEVGKNGAGKLNSSYNQSNYLSAPHSASVDLAWQPSSALHLHPDPDDQVHLKIVLERKVSSCWVGWKWSAQWLELTLQQSVNHMPSTSKEEWPIRGGLTSWAGCKGKLCWGAANSRLIDSPKSKALLVTILVMFSDRRRPVHRFYMFFCRCHSLFIFSLNVSQLQFVRLGSTYLQH